MFMNGAPRIRKQPEALAKEILGVLIQSQAMRVFTTKLLELAGWFACAILASSAAQAQELLLNPSFEAPVTPANGNNLYATIPDWTVINVVPAQAQPFNVVRPWFLYSGNPTATPVGGGVQYLDIASASGTIRQTIIVPSTGMIDISGWFSVRDFPQALSGLNINLRTPGGTLVATTNTSFTIFDPIGLWKQAAIANIPLTAGSYILEVEVPNYANVDLLSAVFKPGLAVAKTSIAFSDPQNGTANPKLIPGGLIEYTISVTSPPSYSVTSNTLVLTDPTPANSELLVTNIGGASSGPAAFGAGSSGLVYTFTSLSSSSDNIEFSDDGGVTWAYVPTANANGADPLVTTVQIRPQGAMAASSTATAKLRYRIK